MIRCAYKAITNAYLDTHNNMCVNIYLSVFELFQKLANIIIKK